MIKKKKTYKLQPNSIIQLHNQKNELQHELPFELLLEIFIIVERT